jgi:acetyl esterase/lipase
MLLLATPVRASELPTAHVSLGYSDFRERLVRLMPDYKSLCGSVTFSLDVVRARNRIVGILLGKPEFADITHVLWVDDDQWPEDVTIVPEMVERCRGVLGAPYTNKREPLRWVHREHDGALSVGMGFTMTTRALLESLAKDARWYVDLPNPIRVPNLFGQLYETVTLPNGEQVETLLSEDYSFCKRAREAGHPVELYEQAGIIHHAGGHVWDARGMPGGVVRRGE